MNIRINWSNPKLTEISEETEPGPEGIRSREKVEGSLHPFGTTVAVVP